MAELATTLAAELAGGIGGEGPEFGTCGGIGRRRGGEEVNAESFCV